MKYNKISILGSGWLGLPLVNRISEKYKSVHLKGSTTTPENLALVGAAGAEAYLMNLSPGMPATYDRSFFDAECLIISIPPRLSKNEDGFYLKQISAVMQADGFSDIRNIVLISSTSVYPELCRIVKEDDVVEPGQSSAPALVEAEQMLESLRPRQTVTILRLGGLLGFDRIPGKYVKGQKDMKTGSVPVNYIHRDDAIGVIISMLERGIVNETFNVVSPLHPTRREVYETSCGLFGWEAPTFLEPSEPPAYKIISAEKLDRFYQYDFLYPDPLDFYYAM